MCAIVAGVIPLCRWLGLRCVLEGVETDDDRAVLPPLDPDLIHGSCFGRPMTGAEARAVASPQVSRALTPASRSAASAR